MKTHSPQGTYLIEHCKTKIWKKHLHIKQKIEHPEKSKGRKVYIYGYDKYGDIVFSSKSKREGLYAVTLNTALELRRIYNMTLNV